jgi:hypothetical protein
MATHELKTWPEPFAAILSGVKRHEVRKADRPFAVGDTLLLREYDPEKQSYTGRFTDVQVTYLTGPGAFGLPADIVVMTVGPVGSDKPTVEKLTARGLHALERCSHEDLVARGLQLWAAGLYLFPESWYDRIPDGYVVEFLDGTWGKFHHGETDNDTRGGMLGFGIRRRTR